MTKLLYSLLFVSLTSVVSFAQCNQVVRQADKQGDKVTVRSTSTGDYWTEPVQYKQVKEKGGTRFYVQLYTLGGSFIDQKGATIFFTDGTVLEWPQARVKAGFKGKAHVSQCSLKLTEDEIGQFQEKKIISLTLSAQERSLSWAQSQRAQDIINCVLYADYCDIKSDKLVNQ
ncbi:MAG: hypothetical protein EOO88_09395 [Pedobacter sp.]|nr:MAG: hypothetical protein EOO88_09395 [Pedobacter sp.]